jgi:hypothetical protein
MKNGNRARKESLVSSIAAPAKRVDPVAANGSTARAPAIAPNRKSLKRNRRPAQVEQQRAAAARFRGDHAPRDKEHHLASRKCRSKSTPQRILSYLTLFTDLQNLNSMRRSIWRLTQTGSFPVLSWTTIVDEVFGRHRSQGGLCAHLAFSKRPRGAGLADENLQWTLSRIPYAERKARWEKMASGGVGGGQAH